MIQFESRDSEIKNNLILKLLLITIWEKEEIE
jgi:hypothetical protein